MVETNWLKLCDLQCHVSATACEALFTLLLAWTGKIYLIYPIFWLNLFFVFFIPFNASGIGHWLYKNIGSHQYILATPLKPFRIWICAISIFFKEINLLIQISNTINKNT